MRRISPEVFVRMLEAIPGQTGNFEAWLFRIAGNLLTDHYRKRAVRPDTVGVHAEMASGDDPAAAAERKLTGERLKQGMRELTEEQKEVVILRFILGYEHGEVAEIMGRSAGAVRALQFRALSALKDALGGRI
jgi:RNA polymerase sigma-70 factor (ECF subfamily)